MMRKVVFGLLGGFAACSAFAGTPSAPTTPPVPQAPPAVQAPPEAAASAAPTAPTTHQSAPALHLAQVSPDALVEMRAHGDSGVFLLDVRTPAEFAAGHVHGAINIPYDQVASRLSEIPKSDEVVLYCHSGRRAGLAAEVLAANGYKKLAHLEGDMTGWQKAGRPVATSAAPAN